MNHEKDNDELGVPASEQAVGLSAVSPAKAPEDAATIPRASTGVAKALKTREREIVSQIDRLKWELDKVRFTLAVLDGSVVFGSYDGDVRFTKGGSIVNIQSHIENAIITAGKPMTVTALADCIYNPSMPLTKEQFRRRLSVHCSVMHKKESRLMSTGYSKNREIAWVLSDKQVDEHGV